MFKVYMLLSHGIKHSIVVMADSSNDAMRIAYSRHSDIDAMWARPLAIQIADCAPIVYKSLENHSHA